MSSLSTVFSLLTSSLSSTTDNGRDISQAKQEENREDTRNGTDFAVDSPSASKTSTLAANTSSTDATATASYYTDLAPSSESNDFTQVNPNNLTAGTSLFEDFYNETITEVNTSIGFNNDSLEFIKSGTFTGSNSTLDTSSSGAPDMNITNDLEFQNLQDDFSNDSISSSTTANYSIDNFGVVKDDVTTYVPLFYFLLTVVLGIYVYLYFLQRHLKAKAERVEEEEHKQRVEERAKRGGCRYDFEDDDESDYGPQEQ